MRPPGTLRDRLRRHTTEHGAAFRISKRAAQLWGDPARVRPIAGLISHVLAGKFAGEGSKYTEAIEAALGELETGEVVSLPLPTGNERAKQLLREALAALEDERTSDTAAQIATLTAERDAARAELAALRGRLAKLFGGAK